MRQELPQFIGLKPLAHAAENHHPTAEGGTLTALPAARFLATNCSTARNSTIGILGGRQFRPISIHTEMSSSFSWFAAIQGTERIEDLVSPAPKGCFIAAEAIKRKAQKSTSNF